MKAILGAIEDGNSKGLFFASMEDAERFKAFCNVYLDESGAGNGYGAYWVYLDSIIIGVTGNPGHSTNIREDLVKYMLDKIVCARTAGEKRGSSVELVMGTSDNGIKFNVGDLPSRLRPGVGDMFRSLRSQGALSKMDGRVIEDNGDILKVVSCWDENKDGSVKDDAKIIEIETSKVMKINDWKKK